MDIFLSFFAGFLFSAVFASTLVAVLRSLGLMRKHEVEAELKAEVERLRKDHEDLEALVKVIGMRLNEQAEAEGSRSNFRNYPGAGQEVVGSLEGMER